MTQKHTPTPWITQQIENHIQIMRGHEYGYTGIGQTYHTDLETNKANAAFIVRACNSHDALVEALEGLLADDGTASSQNINKVLKAREKARTALALAKGE